MAQVGGENRAHHHRGAAHNPNHRIAVGFFDLHQKSPNEEVGSRGSGGTYLGVWVPGVVTIPIGVLSSPAAMAARIRAQNASSMAK